MPFPPCCPSGSFPRVTAGSERRCCTQQGRDGAGGLALHSPAAGHSGAVILIPIPSCLEVGAAPLGWWSRLWLCVLAPL